MQRELDPDVMSMLAYVWALNSHIHTKNELPSRRASQDALVVELGLQKCANYYL